MKPTDMELIEFAEYYINKTLILWVKKELEPITWRSYHEKLEDKDISGYTIRIGYSASYGYLDLDTHRKSEGKDYIETANECYQRALVKQTELLQKLGY